MKKIKSRSYKNTIKSAAGDRGFTDTLKVGDRIKVTYPSGFGGFAYGKIVSVLPTTGGEKKYKVKFDNFGGDVETVSEYQIIGLASAAGDRGFIDTLKVGDRVKVTYPSGFGGFAFGEIVAVLPEEGGEKKYKVKFDNFGGGIEIVSEYQIIGLASDSDRDVFAKNKSRMNKIAHPIRICQHILQKYFKDFENALTSGDKETAERLLDHMKKELARVPQNNNLKNEFDENLPKG